ncbi:MAG: aspartyl protease family protein, partial [Pyrinomonadaceae bacterium]
ATVMDQELVNELKLPNQGTTKIGDPANPEAITATRNQVDKLQMGGATFANFIAVSWYRSALYQPGAPRGVLGMPLFSKLLLTIDYPNGKIGISRGALPKADGGEVIEYSYSETGLFGVPLNVAGKDLIATLDTGSPGELSFPTEYQEKLPLEGKPVEIGRARTVAGESVIYGAKLTGQVKLGGHKFDDPRVTFFGRLTHLNIGYGFIRDFAISIDQVNRRMRWVRTTPVAAPVTASVAVPATPSAAGEFAQYAGNYGIRQVTVTDGKLYLQRLSGPHGEGPKLELSQVKRDEFALSATTEVRFKFIRDPNGRIVELKVLNPDGAWESAARSAN